MVNGHIYTPTTTDPDTITVSLIDNPTYNDFSNNTTFTSEDEITQHYPHSQKTLITNKKKY